MGIIVCELDKNYRSNEAQEEIKMKEDENSLNKIYNKYDSKKSKMKSRPQKKTKINSKYVKNLKDNKKFHGKLNLSKKLFNLKKDDEHKNCEKEINDNGDELIIISQRNNVILDSCNKEITEDYTIRNETGVYKIENSSENIEIVPSLKQINKDNNSVKDEKIVSINNNPDKKKIQNNTNKSTNDNLFTSKSFICKKKVITKALDLNDPIQNIIEINNDFGNNADYSSNLKKQKIINKTNSNNKGDKGDKISKRKIINQDKNKKSSTSKSKKSININNRNFNILPLNDVFRFSYENHQISALENNNIHFNNIFPRQSPLLQKEEIFPNIERKTYQEDLFIKSQNYAKKKLYSEPKKKNVCKNQYYIIHDNGENYDNSKIVQNLNNIYYYFNNQKNNEELSYKKSNSPNNIHKDNFRILRKETDIHINKNHYENKNNNFQCYNNNHNNLYFSLFNNRTNSSINFINKATKSAKNSKKVIPFLDKQNINAGENNNYYLNKNKDLTKPFLKYNYNNCYNMTSKNHIIKKCNKKDKSRLTNSKSYNNIFNNNNSNKNKKDRSKLFTLRNSANPLNEFNRDIIEIYMPKKGKTLIDDEIINNAIGNVFIFRYKFLDDLDTEKILYDGIIYKVIDNMEETHSVDKSIYKYELLERYFQITKNCFKYYNNIKEAIKEKDKPLVQFDIRCIKAIEIIENKFLKNYRINGNKNIKIIFCIYIRQNNDFFIFAHNNIYIGNNVISVLLFLKKYYEDK